MMVVHSLPPAGPESPEGASVNVESERQVGLLKSAGQGDNVDVDARRHGSCSRSNTAGRGSATDVDLSKAWFCQEVGNLKHTVC